MLLTSTLALCLSISMCAAQSPLQTTVCEYSTPVSLQNVCKEYCAIADGIEEGMDKRRPLPLKRRPLPLKREYFEEDDLPLKRGAPPRLPLGKRGAPKLPLKRDFQPDPLPLKRGRYGSLFRLKGDSLFDEKRRPLPLKRLGGRAFGYGPQLSRSRIGVWPWMYELIRRSRNPSKRSVDYYLGDDDELPLKRAPLPLKRAPLPLKRAPLPLKRSPLPLKRAPLPLKRATNAYQWEAKLESDICLCYGMCRRHQLEEMCDCDND